MRRDWPLAKRSSRRASCITFLALCLISFALAESRSLPLRNSEPTLSAASSARRPPAPRAGSAASASAASSSPSAGAGATAIPFLTA